jgi:putative aldouronate transport system substrate-binding protein
MPNRRVSRISSLVLCVALVAGTVFAAGTTEEGTTSAPVDIKIMMPGDRPADFDMVKPKAEEWMANDGLNYTLDAVFVPWSDLGNKTQVTLASGEQIDLIFDAPWLHLSQMIAEGYYEPLDDLIAEHGPNLFEVRPELMWEANKYNGKIMGVPMGAYHHQGRTFHYRADVAEDLGFGSIESFDELVEFMYAVRENVPGLIPFSTHPTAVDMSMTDVRIQYDYDLQIRGTGVLPQSIVLHYKGNDGVVYNLLDEVPAEVWRYVQETRTFYEDGIINPDLAAGVDHGDLMRNGKVAVIVNNDIKLDLAAEKVLKDAVPGAELDYFTLYSFEPGDNIVAFKQWNFQCVPVISENKVEAIKFLDWANASQENYDLLAYGIEGTHFEPVGEDQYKTLASYRWFPYAWVWNPEQDRIDAGLPERDKEAARFFQDADNFTADILTGFSFDATPVQNEIAVYNNLANEFYLIMNGIVEPREAWEEFREKAYDPVKAVQVELQRQIDAFLAAK